jgi:hypothetical protein
MVLIAETVLLAILLAACFMGRHYAVRTEAAAAEAEAHAVAAQRTLAHILQVHERMIGKPVPDIEQWLREQQLDKGSHDFDQ